MPAASVWGPFLWRFLHVFGAITYERSSKQTKCKKDEDTEARWILTNIHKIIPCKECLAHLIAFKEKCPLPSTPAEYAEWLWIFHESVNEKLKKEAGPPLNDVLAVTGTVGNLWKEYIKCIDDSIIQNHIRKIHVIEYQRHVYMWLNYLL